MPRAPEFFAPAPLFGVAVLLLNDHVFKSAFHNTLTGKLSDVAGCFFLPLYVSAVLALLTNLRWQHRVASGAALTALLFTSIKISAHASEVVTSSLEVLSQPLGIARLHVVADPTDLIALPMVVVAILFARRSHACTAALSN